jgi:hypothetical protein
MLFAIGLGGCTGADPHGHTDVSGETDTAQDTAGWTPVVRWTGTWLFAGSDALRTPLGGMYDGSCLAGRDPGLDLTWRDTGEPIGCSEEGIFLGCAWHIRVDEAGHFRPEAQFDRKDCNGNLRPAAGTVDLGPMQLRSTDGVEDVWLVMQQVWTTKLLREDLVTVTVETGEDYSFLAGQAF